MVIHGSRQAFFHLSVQTSCWGEGWRQPKRQAFPQTSVIFSLTGGPVWIWNQLVTRLITWSCWPLSCSIINSPTMYRKQFVCSGRHHLSMLNRCHCPPQGHSYYYPVLSLCNALLCWWWSSPAVNLLWEVCPGDVYISVLKNAPSYFLFNAYCVPRGADCTVHSLLSWKTFGSLIGNWSSPDL